VAVFRRGRGEERSSVRGGMFRGSSGAFIGVGGAPERGGQSNGSVNGLNAIEDGGEVKRGIKGGNDGGAVMAQAASRGAEWAARGAAAWENLVVTQS
jgi:hypothetical protein